MSAGASRRRSPSASAADTSLTLAYVHQRDDNTPIYGVPYYLNQLNDGPLPEADDSDYFGYRNLDEQETTVDRLTATVRHEFSDAISIRNLTRWQRVDALTVASAPQGTFCLTGTGRQPVPANADRDRPASPVRPGSSPASICPRARAAGSATRRTSCSTPRPTSGSKRAKAAAFTTPWSSAAR